MLQSLIKILKGIQDQREVRVLFNGREQVLWVRFTQYRNGGIQIEREWDHERLLGLSSKRYLKHKEPGPLLNFYGRVDRQLNKMQNNPESLNAYEFELIDSAIDGIDGSCKKNLKDTGYKITIDRKM